MKNLKETIIHRSILAVWGGIGAGIRGSLWLWTFQNENPLALWITVIINCGVAFAEGFLIWFVIEDVKWLGKHSDAIQYGLFGGLATFAWIFYDIQQLYLRDQASLVGWFITIFILGSMICAWGGRKVGVYWTEKHRNWIKKMQQKYPSRAKKKMDPYGGEIPRPEISKKVTRKEITRPDNEQEES